MILSQQFSLAAAKGATRPALHYLGKDITYAELRTRIGRLSYLLQNELSAVKEPRVAFFARNSPAMVATFFALTNIRATSIFLSPDSPPDRMLDALRESGATHVAVTSDLVNQARSVLGSARLSLPLIEFEKKQGGEYDTSFTPAPDNAPIDTDPILWLPTAGTLGKPRFASFNHKQLYHAALAARGPYHLLPTDRVLTSLSWAHPFAWVHGLLMPLFAGATAVIDHGAQGKDYLEFLGSARVTRLLDRPDQLLKLLMICKAEKRGLPGLKSVTVGMGFLADELRKVYAALKIPAAHCYGQAESAWAVAMEDVEEVREAAGGATPKRCVGKGLAGMKYKVLDTQGDEITGKEARQGLLAVMGPSIMMGYPQLEKETKQTLRGTWLYTGDYARLEGDGDSLRITFLGRRDEVLAQGNELTPVHEIDAAIRGLTGVQDAAGFVVTDARGEPVVACAVVKVQGNALSEKQIIGHGDSRLPPKIAPRVVVFTDVIPRDAGGNVNRARLRAQYAGSANS